jgi:hypothetical protein
MRKAKQKDIPVAHGWFGHWLLREAEKTIPAGFRKIARRSR